MGLEVLRKTLKIWRRREERTFAGPKRGCGKGMKVIALRQKPQGLKPNPFVWWFSAGLKSRPFALSSAESRIFSDV
jgi:hypothetical protein